MRRLTPALLLFVAGAAIAAAPGAVVVPVDIINNRVHLPVSVNGHPAGSFVLDTGAGGSPLDRDYAKRVGVRGSGSGRAIGAVGSVQISTATNVPYRFGGIDFTAKRAGLIPLEPVSLRAGRPIDGILGQDVLARYVTEIDYARGQVTFHNPRAHRPPSDAVALPVQFEHGVPRVRAQVTLPDGRTIPVTMLIDTGAGTGVILNRAFVKRHNVELPPGLDTSIGLGVGGASTERISRIPRLEFGGFTFEQPVTLFSHATEGALGRTTLDGVIGGELLRRFTLTVDYPRKRMLFAPNAGLRDPFEFDMSGALLNVRDTTFTTVLVRDVLPSSPAAEAGVRVGDVLRAVDGREVTPARLEEIRNLFKQADKRLTLTLLRDGEERTVTLTTRRLI